MVEADAEVVWSAFVAVVSVLARRARLGGLSIGAMAGSVSVDESVFVDASGRPLGLVIMAPDTRTSGAMWTWLERDSYQWLYGVTGLPRYPSHALPRLLWLRRRRPRQFAKVAGVWDWAAFIVARLGLPATTDPSVAARTMAWDIRAGTWSRAVLDAAELGEHLFPRVVPTGAVIGRLPSGVAHGLGLPVEVTMVAGGMDQWLAAVGTGVTDPAQALVGTGTWEAITAPLDHYPAAAEELRASGISIGPFVTPARYAAMASQIGGGALANWFREVFAPRQTLARLVRSVPDRPTGLLVLPHMEGSLSPWMDPASRGTISGFGLDTDRRTLLRGFMEGATFELRENLSRIEASGLRVTDIRASGGGARSLIWLQLKADVLGRPVTAVDVSENAAFGAALIAGGAVGLLPPIAMSSRDLVRPTHIYEPRAALTAAYDEIFMRYQQLYPALLALRRDSPPREVN